ncbi:MAG: hypothetical protein RBG13Loki_2746 [Promethearchaeota archaeon CR_4]|nr:MAG: hypothetical protein RBG13Loki_2746 [Candidatus Lokiarchaeota archaeon CR_4]
MFLLRIEFGLWMTSEVQSKSLASFPLQMSLKKVLTFRPDVGGKTISDGVKTDVSHLIRQMAGRPSGVLENHSAAPKKGSEEISPQISADKMKFRT